MLSGKICKLPRAPLEHPEPFPPPSKPSKVNICSCSSPPPPTIKSQYLLIHRPPSHKKSIFESQCFLISPGAPLFLYASYPGHYQIFCFADWFCLCLGLRLNHVSQSYQKMQHCLRKDVFGNHGSSWTMSAFASPIRMDDCAYFLEAYSNPSSEPQWRSKLLLEPSSGPQGRLKFWFAIVGEGGDGTVLFFHG